MKIIRKFEINSNKASKYQAYTIQKKIVLREMSIAINANNNEEEESKINYFHKVSLVRKEKTTPKATKGKSRGNVNRIRNKI